MSAGDEVEECGASFEAVAPGGVEVACVPWVCHVARSAGEVHEETDFPFGVVVEDTHHVADVIAVHADDDVVAAIVVGTDLPCAVSVA